MAGFTAENRLLDIQVLSVCYLPGVDCIFISKRSLSYKPRYNILFFPALLQIFQL